ncbi:HAD-IA family hydrolase [Thiopseudomonas alkaliphila]|uniref:HAD-IA family hydrolase n=1 Tax=Thiopseudomonas alkaliphila TaxID=1697053 RepID=UPI002575EF72|nr:HAD-IA family hydrolase [Thiopseudomonas alkaliphila]MDM1706879.1 HAD-IA family hydrolase [Thiopseudomonas alkaliphila]
MQQTKYPLLIFDWDGTLVDSIDRIVQSVRHAAERNQLEQREEYAIRGIIGLSLADAFAVLYPAQATDGALRQQFIADYSQHYIAQESTPSAFYPHVREQLERFKEQGYQLAVATGKSRRGLDRVLIGHKLQQFFDITRCADETQGKPHPQMLHEILAYCGKTPAQAVMLGDSPFDLQMAHHAQIDSVAVSYGAQRLEVLLQEQPLYYIDCFSALAPWLAQQSASHT